MGLAFTAEPPGSRIALENGLKALALAPTPAAGAHLAAIGGAQAPPPLPVYVFPIDDLVAGNDPQGGSPVAWEYLLVSGNQPVRTADVIPDPVGPQPKFTFASISDGAATGIAQAIDVAEQDRTIAGGQYEMRMIRVPALYVTALWLKDQKGTTDYYILIPPVPQGFNPLRVGEAFYFFRDLKKAAHEKKNASPPPSATSTSLTN